MAGKDRPHTPDSRYFVARGRLNRCTDPALDDSTRRAGIKALMQARRAVMQAGSDPCAMRDARAAVDAAKVRLGERGPVWWSDGAPDEAGIAPETSSYAAWWASLGDAERARGA